MDKYDTPDRQVESSTEKSSNENLHAVISTDVGEVTHNLPWQTWAVVAACSMWGFIYAGTQITLLFWTTAITADIGGATEGLWLGQAFQVVTALAGPALARIGDTCGRRYVILFGVFMGGVGVIIISVAPNINVAIAGACVFGLCYGSGGNVYTVSSEVLPRRHRGTAQVTILLGSIAGVLCGLFVGAQLITTHPGSIAGWRSASWFNVGTHALTFLLFAVFYHPEPPPNPAGYTVMQRVMHFDWVGISLLSCGICPLMVGLIWGGAVYPWGSATIITTLVVGFAFFGILAIHQLYVKKDGLCTHELFHNRNFAMCLASIAVEGIIYNVFTHYFAVETAILWEPRPIFLALRFAVFTLGAAFVCPLYGWYVYWKKDAKHVLIFGYAAFLAGVIGMACAKIDTDQITIVYGTLAGVGFAAPLVFLNMVTQLSVPPEIMGLATALVISSRSIGGAIGIAVTGAVFTAKTTESIPAYVGKAAAEAGLPLTSLPQFIGGLASMNKTLVATTPGVTPEIVAAGTLALKYAFVYSFRYIWLTTIPFIAVGIIGLFFLKGTQKDMNAVVDRGQIDTRHKDQNAA